MRTLDGALPFITQLLALVGNEDDVDRYRAVADEIMDDRELCTTVITALAAGVRGSLAQLFTACGLGEPSAADLDSAIAVLMENIVTLSAS